MPGIGAGKVARARLAGYRNPLRAVQGLTPERIDMGVDYAGAGPVYAIGPGTVALAAVGASSPWAGTGGPGGWIAYQLTAGPFQGQFVYVAEGVTPRVGTGARVNSSTVIGLMAGGIETGFAAAPGTGTTLAAAHNQELAGLAQHGDPGALPTAYGVAFSDLMRALGAPGGIMTGPVQGTVPPGFGIAPISPGLAGGGAVGQQGMPGWGRTLLAAAAGLAVGAGAIVVIIGGAVAVAAAGAWLAGRAVREIGG